jgi:hypothetical protein
MFILKWKDNTITLNMAHSIQVIHLITFKMSQYGLILVFTSYFMKVKLNLSRFYYLIQCHLLVCHKY